MQHPQQAWSTGWESRALSSAVPAVHASGVGRLRSAASLVLGLGQPGISRHGTAPFT